MTIRRGTFAFDQDAESGALRITLSGFWSLETVHAYERAVLAMIAARDPDRGPPQVLIDLRDADLHRGAVERMLAAFHRLHTPDTPKVAAVVRSSVDAAQALAISCARETRTFASIEDARAWLA